MSVSWMCGIYRSGLYLALACLSVLAAQAQETTEIVVKPPAIEDRSEAGKPYKTKINVGSAKEDIQNLTIAPSDLTFTDEAGKVDASKKIDKSKVKVDSPPTLISHNKGADINLAVDGLSVGDYKGELVLKAPSRKSSKVSIHIIVNTGVANNTSGTAVLPATVTLAFPTNSSSIDEQSGSTSEGFFAGLKNACSRFTGGMYKEGRTLAFRAGDKSVNTGTLYYVENPDAVASTFPLPRKCVTAILLDAADTAKAHTGGSPVSVSLGVNKYTSVQIQVDAEDLAPGRYSGAYNLLVSDRAPLSIPVTLTRRIRPIGAYFWLIVGVGCGIGLAAFRTRQLPRDLILARAGRLQMRILQEPAFLADAKGGPAVAAVFVDRLQAKIDQAVNFAQDQTDSAKTKLEEADIILSRWMEHKSDWVSQLEYVHKLSAQIKQIAGDMGSRSRYLNGLITKLDAAEEGAPDKPDATELRTTSAEVAEWLRTYGDATKGAGVLNQLLAQLRPRIGDLPVADQAEAQKTMNQIDQRMAEYNRIDSLAPDVVNKLNLPDNSTDIGKIIENERKDIAAVTDLIKRIHVVSAAALQVIPTDVVPKDVHSPPGLTTGSTVHEGLAANSRIRSFYGLSYSIVALLLVMTGFSQLYWPNATFGATPLDLMTLIAWGFGVDTLTRPAVLGAFNYLGLTAGRIEPSNL